MFLLRHQTFVFSRTSSDVPLVDLFGVSRFHPDLEEIDRDASDRSGERSSQTIIRRWLSTRLAQNGHRPTHTDAQRRGHWTTTLRTVRSINIYVFSCKTRVSGSIRSQWINLIIQSTAEISVCGVVFPINDWMRSNRGQTQRRTCSTNENRRNPISYLSTRT